MVTTLQPAAAKNGNSIHVHLADNVNTMRADITKVRQILFNLLSNACKFTDRGSVSVNVEQIKVEDRDWIQFQVRDTGIGISAKQKENLFQEFAQADASIARKYGGTGLGLAITHRFVQLMKGCIWVESDVGQGAVFTVRLPVQVVIETAESAPPESAGKVPAASSETKTGLETILVIDDDPSVRDLMSRFLTKLDFHVEIQFCQEARHQIADRRVIVYHQNRFQAGLGLGRCRRNFAGTLWRRGFGCLDDDLNRQPDRKNGALANVALYPNAPLHQLNEAVSDGESQAGPAILAGNRGVRLGKLLKQVFLLLGGDADPGVTN